MLDVRYGPVGFRSASTDRNFAVAACCAERASGTATRVAIGSTLPRHGKAAAELSY